MVYAQMIYIIAGSRNFKDKCVFLSAMMDHHRYVETIMYGRYATYNHIDEWVTSWAISNSRKLADTLGIEEAKGDVLLAFWDGECRDTADMIKEALNKGLEVHVYRDSK